MTAAGTLAAAPVRAHPAVTSLAFADGLPPGIAPPNRAECREEPVVQSPVTPVPGYCRL